MEIFKLSPTELAAILKEIAWPATIVFIILLFREELTKLINRIKNAKFRGMELEFTDDLTKIEEKADKISLPDVEELNLQNLQKQESFQHISELDSLNVLAKSQPNPVIQKAWRIVNKAVDDTQRSLNVPKAFRGSAGRAIKLLETNKYINSEIVELYQQLGKLEKRAALLVRSGEIENDLENVERYLNLCKRVVNHLDNLKLKKTEWKR